MEHSNVLQQLVMAARALNVEHNWQLTSADLQSYAEALSQYYAESGKPGMISMHDLLINYHHDHATVTALGDSQHAEHFTAWQKVRGQVRVTLTRLYNENRLSISPGCFEDLIQEAAEDIWCGLDQFRYNSRLSTWQYRVVARCASRSCRAGMAKRRGSGATPHSLDALIDRGGMQLTAPHTPRPDEHMLYNDLRRIIAAVLSAAPDARLQQIFELSAYQDYTLREIGGKLNLSAARVNGLLRQARYLLSTNPVVCAWFNKELVL